MREIGALEAAGQLGALLDLVERGEEVVITRDGRAVARLVPGMGTRDRAVAEAAAQRILARSQGATLGPDLTLRDLIDEGRR